ncbi:T9SS type A sorting domain-containing protein [Plebeiibacterium sediminum]|uniref:T9SS type A sorting domain-containing protein n=1 Tax=Plebeiibacterium sediminum TaxID=2992112 RepID=A0AAE3M7J5_9BACT|nr:T9SS type A sorting domain-containing protein [Plebeiobacterium sediminum]MCW3788259.1 T9SS type A sorting domain-containing protein [Plebeiobacterium sediminum]
MKKLLFLVPFFVCIGINAQLSIVSVNTNYIIDFESSIVGVNNGVLNASGFSSDPQIGQLDSDGIIITGCSDGEMNFGDEKPDGDFARGSSTGGKTTGGIYACEVEENNYALGMQPTGGDLSEGAIILKVSNQTGNTIAELSVLYDIWIYNDQGRSNSFNFLYSTDNVTYVPIPELDYSTAEAADESVIWTKKTQTTTFTIQISDTENAYLKWISDDVSGDGSRDEIAIDNIQIKATSAGNNTDIRFKSEQLVSIAPNPCINQLTIQCKNQIKDISVYDLSGKLILSKKDVFQDKIVLPISDINSGIYMIKITDQKGKTEVRKFVKCK